MTLGSQAPRAAASRQYMVSSRRRGSRRLPAVVAALAVLGVLAYFFWPQAGSSDAAVTRDPDQPTDATPTAPAQPRNNITPPQPRQAVAPPPRHDALTLGGPATTTTPTPTPTPRPAATTPTRTAPQPAATSPTPRATDERVRRGMDLIADGQLVEGRHVLSELLFADPPVLSAIDADAIRTTLASINKTLVFSSDAIDHDPLTRYHVVQSGDRLAKIAPQHGVPYQFIELINDTPATQLRVGQKIKLVNGPFHARIAKRDYRMDLFLVGANDQPVYVMSMPVGLGEDDSTPVGLWRIRQGSKVTNPDWRNPRTGEHFKADDPDNPIGEFWMALEGLDEATAGIKGYGIHGTTDQDSIGDQQSMGCVRLRDQDIQLLFQMLLDGESTVEIMP